MTRLERLPQVAKVMKEYNIHILGLSETRWNGFGETQCDFGYSLLYSGKEEDATREYGVGLLLSRSAKSSLLSWKPVSERIICARFSTRVRKVTVIQCYAPTNSASTDVKSQFYEQLGHTLKGIKKQDIVILMGDINAKMGNDNVDREYYMGQYGATGTINENGELFGDHGLVIGGTLFKHKECHKVTWISPDGKTKNQIDHVAISKTWRSSLLDVRNKRGADIDSDHHLVVAEVRLKIAVPHRKPDKAARKFNIRKLEDSNCREKFGLSLKNSFELLKEIEDEQMDETWDRIRGAYNKAAKEVLGYTNTKQEPWMSAELWAAIEKRQLLNTPILGSPSDAMLHGISVPDLPLDIPIAPPTFNEIVKAIKQLKPGKAPGIDNINAEMLKADAPRSASLLYPLIVRIWETEQIPSQWKQRLLVKVPKKGDLSSCDNWSGITLLPCAAKVLARLLLNRMSKKITGTLREEQAGFLPGRSCTDHTNTLRILIEQSVEWQTEMILTFVDFEKAFDTVQWSKMWACLKQRGIPNKIIGIIQALYRGSTCRVVHDQVLGAPIEMTAGVKQGCLLSPLLFIMLLDDIMREVVTTPRGIEWSENILEDLHYADDIVLMTPTLDQMQAKLEDLRISAEKRGLRINTNKTVDMRVMSKNTTPLKLQDCVLKSAQKFTYLGSSISNQGGSDEDIEIRIRKARGAFAQLKPVWESSVMTRRIKLTLFDSIVKSVLLFGCETWRVTKTLTNRLQEENQSNAPFETLRWERMERRISDKRC
ncbi:uncharacterized protein LOC134201663 [Bombyx mori]|uniref:uncharacterized protein LOC134201663 n=1 Tax=Bombyx mori TaxID=7091 RepID=UPI002ED32C55